ncbi:biopolymer transporter ExbD [Aliikangiella marina]|uniref:Biopolymer transporter ExbD n=1 Tax=Aliikangiella marina TaxID=1712262 RepID=A0A545TGR1_9GAMM|nr:biopolymer transporter ExbD [Aliikangiella marina]TQV76424.1 biopolymer transporter ExbD [Aliikangiella marina]
MKFVRRNYIQEAKELNITAFMNLMVILVPFLLVTAVFSRLTVLELNLPALDAAAKQQENVKLQLQLIVRSEEIVIQDVNLGVIQRLARDDIEQSNWKKFSDILLEIKRRFPAEDSITLLFEKDISYKTLIQIMDYVRSTDVVQITEVQTVELFPNISIGDAEDILTDSPASETVPDGAAQNSSDTNNTTEAQ